MVHFRGYTVCHCVTAPRAKAPGLQGDAAPSHIPELSVDRKVPTPGGFARYILPTAHLTC